MNPPLHFTKFIRNTLLPFFVTSLAACSGGSSGAVYPVRCAAPSPIVYSSVDTKDFSVCPAINTAAVAVVHNANTGELKLIEPAGVLLEYGFSSGNTVVFTSISSPATVINATIDLSRVITPRSTLTPGAWDYLVYAHAQGGQPYTKKSTSPLIIPVGPLTTRLIAQGTLVNALNSGMNAINLPIGELVQGINWNAAIFANNANSSAGITQTRVGAMINGRAINAANWSNQSIASGNCTHFVFADDGASAMGSGANANFSCVPEVTITYKGEADGFAVKRSNNNCYKILYNGTNWVTNFRALPSGHTNLAPGNCTGL
jgi:hypothetical protein